MRRCLWLLLAACTPAGEPDPLATIPRSAGASREPGETNDVVVLHASATTHWPSVFHALRTSSAEEHLVAIVVADDDGAARHIAMWPNPMGRRNQVHPIPVRIDEEGVDIAGRRATSLAEVREIAHAVHLELPHEPLVRVSAFDGATLQEVVDVLDALRGPGVSLDAAFAGEEVPEECWFWQVAVEPFVRRPDIDSLAHDAGRRTECGAGRALEPWCR